MKIKKKPLVIVEWGDAHAGSTWTRADRMQELASPLKVTWIGYLVSNTEEGIHLSFGFDENGNWAGNMFVPRGMIRKIRKVRY